MNDVMATSATIVALVASLVTDLPVDSLIGAKQSLLLLSFLVSLSQNQPLIHFLVSNQIQKQLKK